MKKVLSFFLAVLTVISLTSCGNNGDSLSKTSSKTKAETTTKTSAETTVSTEKREIKGDRTIRNAVEINIPDIWGEPIFVNDNMLSVKIVGDVKDTIWFGTESGPSYAELIPMEFGITDCRTGKYTALFKEDILPSYYGNYTTDGENVFLNYYTAENFKNNNARTEEEPDSVCVGSFDVYKYLKTIKINLKNKSVENIDLGLTGYYFIDSLSNNKLYIEQTFCKYGEYSNNINNFYENQYIYDLKDKKLKQFNSYECNYDGVHISPKWVPSKKIYYYFGEYEGNIVFSTEELKPDKTVEAGIAIYDNDMKIVFDGVLESAGKLDLENFDRLWTEISFSNSTIYARLDKYVSETAESTYAYYSIKNRTGNYEIKNIDKQTYDERKLALDTQSNMDYSIHVDEANNNIIVYNNYTEENYSVIIESKEFYIYRNLQSTHIYNNDRCIIKYCDPVSDDVLGYLIIPKEEILRAIGEN